MTSERSLRFPDGFLWGTATSPTQVEGGVQNEWTNFTARDGSNCHVACDHYNRYAEDVDWMAKLGMNAYRLGIEWSRLQSAPYAPLNQKELAHYVDILDCLKAAGVTPMVVLHHFSNPPWLMADGGWTNGAAIGAFVDFAAKVAVALKDRVRLWNTFNEPDTYACLGYLLGGYPPQRVGKLGQFRKVIAHMAHAHAGASRAIRRAYTGGVKPEIGIAKNWTFFHAYKKYSPWDRATAFACRYTFNKFVLDAFLGSMRTHPETSTFIGLNYYGRVRFHHFQAMIPAGGASLTKLEDFGFICDDMVERYPEGLTKILAYLHRRFQIPIYITEHGSASSNEQFRVSDLRENLTALHRAMSDGVDVRGFFYWSLMDNFEWQFGYTKKFGLLEVDFKDPKLPRKMKPLAAAYAKICRENSIG